MKSKVYLISAFFIILILYFTAGWNAGQWLVKEDSQLEADIIIILMGNIADRVLQVADLYKQGLAGKVIMVEESMGPYHKLKKRGVNIVNNSSQSQNALVNLGVPGDSIIILPGDATSTQMEAVILRNYLKNKPDIDTLLLVSSASHMRRASMIFKAAFRKAEMPMHVVSCPSKYSGFNADKWWRSKEDVQKVFMEYLKIANFLVFERRGL
ncbi:MAG: YdcF family protein [Bacteroidota bacterium]